MNIEYSNATCKKYFNLIVYSDKFILKPVLCFRILGFLVAFLKLRHYEKATKFEKKSPIWFDKTAVSTQ